MIYTAYVTLITNKEGEIKYHYFEWKDTLDIIFLHVKDVIDYYKPIKSQIYIIN